MRNDKQVNEQPHPLSRPVLEPSRELEERERPTLKRETHHFPTVDLELCILKKQSSCQCHKQVHGRGNGSGT